MSELVQMRQRIKAIETIKKITHAMRLISMSAHSRLKHKQEPLATYVQEFNTLFAKLQLLAPDWKNPILSSSSDHGRTLIILIGSQKGLCGSFNTTLFHVCTQHITQLPTTPYLIAIGKKAVDHIHDFPGSVLATFDQFSMNTLFVIAHDVANFISQTQPPFTRVEVLSNIMQNFFIQRPQIKQLVPFKHEQQTTTTLGDDYLWEQKPQLILDTLVQQYLETQIQSLLFQSLLAEHAARFISMDSSTRNAESLLEASKLQYNKLRQAKITKELTELSGSF